MERSHQRATGGPGGRALQAEIRAEQRARGGLTVALTNRPAQLETMSRTTQGESHTVVLQAMIGTLNFILRGVDSHCQKI